MALLVGQLVGKRLETCASPKWLCSSMVIGLTDHKQFKYMERNSVQEHGGKKISVRLLEEKGDDTG